MLNRGLLAGALLCLCPATPAYTQMQVDVIPFVGAYLPVSNLAEEQIIDPDIGTIDAELKQKASFLFGGRVDLWFPSGFGLRGTFAYALSDLVIKGTSGGSSISIDIDASVQLGTARAAYTFGTRVGSTYNVTVSGGLMLLSREGDFWEGAVGTTDLGGVVGVGLRLDLSEQLGLTFDFDDYIYSASFGERGDETESKFQNDLTLTGGLLIKLGR